MGSQDPIIDLLKGFSYNAVRVPREGIQPLQLLVKQDKNLTFFGELTEVFTPGATPPPKISPDQLAAFINGQRSSDLQLNVGLSLLGGIVGAMTGASLDLGVGFKRAKSVAFNFNDVKQAGISQAALSKFLTAAKPDALTGPTKKLLEDDKLYVITSVLKSPKFTVEATGADGLSADIDVPVLQQVVKGKAGVKIEKKSQSNVTFAGNVPLVFGFQAVQLEFQNGQLVDLKQAGSSSAAMRSVSAALKEPTYVTLQVDSPFVNLAPLPSATKPTKRSAAKPAVKAPAAKKVATKTPAAKKPIAKKPAAKKSLTGAQPVTGAKKAASKAAVKAKPAAPAARKATATTAKPGASKAIARGAKKPSGRK